MYSFNSLQTGKHIQSNEIDKLTDDLNVSIPFKRESIYKEDEYGENIAIPCVSIPFKRESIYKVRSRRWMVLQRKAVSIPFKRESIYKALKVSAKPSPALTSFNSLQTGKHIQRRNPITTCEGKAVMFQFPSNGKAYTKLYNLYKRRYTKCVYQSFNSLQTGKHIQSKRNWDKRLDKMQFQFPSNGKAYTKWSECESSSPVVRQVSIPFKRESIYKAIYAFTNCITENLEFQFPSNGKAYTKLSLL